LLPPPSPTTRLPYPTLFRSAQQAQGPARPHHVPVQAVLSLLAESGTWLVHEEMGPPFPPQWMDRFSRAIRGRSGSEAGHGHGDQDRKSTRLNSSHQIISYAV